MSSSCVCRTNTFRKFLRNVTQIHLPNEPATRAPWQESRRHVHNRIDTRWPAVSSLPHRRIHTESNPSASSDEEAAKPTPVEVNNSSSAPRARPYRTELYPESYEVTEQPRSEGVRKKTTAGYGTRFGNQPMSQSPRRNPKHRQGQAATWRDDPELSGLSLEEKAARRAERQKEKELARREYEERRAKIWKERERVRKEEMPMWGLQKEALEKKFPEGWQPRKRLSPDAITGIKELHKQFPGLYTTEVLAHKFEVSPEAIRRILKAKWEPTAEEEEARQARWFRRGVSVWSRWAELGLKPPKKWRDEGVVRKVTPGGMYEPPPQQEEPTLEDVDPQKARRLKVMSRIAQNLV